MTNEELNRALYEKMQAEMQEYTDWLKGLPTEDILNHTYESSRKRIPASAVHRDAF